LPHPRSFVSLSFVKYRPPFVYYSKDDWRGPIFRILGLIRYSVCRLKLVFFFFFFPFAGVVHRPTSLFPRLVPTLGRSCVFRGSPSGTTTPPCVKLLRLFPVPGHLPPLLVLFPAIPFSGTAVGSSYPVREPKNCSLWVCSRVFPHPP